MVAVASGVPAVLLSVKAFTLIVKEPVGEGGRALTAAGSR